MCTDTQRVRGNRETSSQRVQGDQPYVGGGGGGGIELKTVGFRLKRPRDEK